MPEITPHILAAADKVDRDLDALDMSTRTLLALLRAGDTQPPGGGGGGGWYATSTYTSGASTTSSGSVSADAAVASGDLLLLTIYADAGSANVTLTPPTGFTQADFLSGGFGRGVLGIYWKIADGTETSLSFSVSFARILRGILRSYHPGSGLAYASPPVDAADILYDGAGGTSHATPTVTTTVANAVLTHVWGHEGSQVFTLPSLDEPQNLTTSQCQIANGDVVQATAGLSTALTATTASSVGAVLKGVVAIKPPA